MAVLKESGWWTLVDARLPADLIANGENLEELDPIPGQSYKNISV